MSGIRVELQLKDGSFTTGMLRAGQSVSSFRKELSRVDPHFRKLDASGKGVVKTVRKADVVSRDFLSTLRDVSIVSGAVTLAFRGITGTAGGLVGSITQVNAEIERLKYQMLGMSTSAEPMREAAASVEYLRQKALQVPFSLNELATSFVKLKATGTDPMAGSLQAVADGIAAFGGTDEQLHRVTLGLVQMSGKGVIQMEEMRQQLGESMPNAMRIMARSMGVSVAELTQAISTGRVEAGAALQAFYAELERTYGGEAQRMMETFSGQVSQLKANLQLLATGEGMKGFFEEQKAGLMEINDFLKSDEAKKFAKEIGEALTAMVRGIRVATKTIYEFREEIGMVISVVAGGVALRTFGRMAASMATSVRFATMALTGLGTEMSRARRMTALGLTGMKTFGVTARTTGLAVGGLRAAVVGFGSAVTAAAPWIAIIGTAIALAADKMGMLSDKTDEAYESLRKYGAESQEQAQSVLAAKELELRRKLNDAENSFFIGSKESRRARKNALIEARRAELEEFIKERDRILANSEEDSTQHSIQQYERELAGKLRVHNEDYRQRQVVLDQQRDQELARTAETGKKSYQITDEFQKKTLENRKERSEAIIETIDDELARLKALQADTTHEDKARDLGRLIDFLNGKRVEAAEQARANGEFGITFTANVEKEEDKIKRGSKLLQNLQAKVKGLSAEMAGAGSEYAKLSFQIARGDYGSIEQGGDAVRELHEALREAVAQKEALDALMEGDRKASSEIESLRLRVLERERELRAELANGEMTDAEKFLFRLNDGAYKGLGPLENIQSDIEGVGTAMRDDAFGQGTLSAIEKVKRALAGVRDIVTGIKTAASGGMGFASAALGSFATGNMRDLIASVESSKDGYNATLDNGRWTGGSQNLTSMTLNEILALQKQMLANPENRALYGDGLGSSALGRYQIVSKTLRGLIKEMGLSGNELFDQGMQDAMADRLLARRGGNLVGLRQEWAGLKNVPDHVIQAALQGSQGINANAGTLPALPSLVSDRQARTEELRTQAEEVRKQEEANRELEFQLARKKELERLMAEKSGSSIALDEGAGKNFSSVVEKIQTGRLGGSRDINAAEYAEILKIAKELDETDKRMAERKKAERQSTEQLKTLEEQRADIATRIAEEQERVKDPNYVGQSNELRRLIEDLDQYVDRVRTAYGADSAAYAEAQRYRKQLIGQQKALDATQRQAGIANEVRDIQEGLMTQNQLRLTQMKRDLARIDDWVAAARAAGLSEVEIVRQAEEAKEAIRAKYGAEMNPVMQQMEEWKDFSGNMMQEATNWTGTLSSGVTSLITGTGDLRSVFGGLVNDMLSAVVSNQFNFLFSSMAGGKAASGAAAAGSKGSKAAGGAKMAAPIRHTGGMANYRGARRMVSASTFANAPRFHTGGIAGAPKLKPNEVPIIAEKDEGIFTKEQMASLAPVGTGGMGPVTINAPVTVSGSSGTAQQNADLAERMAKEMESTMRGVVVDELRKQGRPGNMMNNRRQGAR